jgi:hypothetical protein
MLASSKPTSPPKKTTESVPPASFRSIKINKIKKHAKHVPADVVLDKS